jgi:hypothetical protein
MTGDEFRPGERVRIGPVFGEVVLPHDTVRVRLETGFEGNFDTRVVQRVPGPRAGREWAVKHPTCTLEPQSENVARFTHAQIPGSKLVHWDERRRTWQEIDS